MIKIVSLLSFTLVLSGCAGSVARLSMQDDEEVYQYILNSEQRDLCVHYRKVIKHFSLDSQDTAYRYIKALNRVANERNAEVFSCKINFDKEYRYTLPRHRAASGFFKLCRSLYALNPIQTKLIGESQATLDQLAQGSDSLKVKDVAETVYDRLKDCQASYETYSGFDGQFPILASKIKDQETQLLLRAYKGQITGQELINGMNSITQSLNSYLITGRQSINMTIAAERAAQQAEREKRNKELQEATDKAWDNLYKSIQQPKTTLKCKPDLKWQMLGQSNMICE